MRLATVRPVAPAGARPLPTTAAVDDAGTWRALPAPDLSALLLRCTPQLDAGASLVDVVAPLAGEALGEVEEVLPLPRPGKVVCCGLNYGDHIRETGRDLPTHPTLFAKFADTLTGPHDDLVLPDAADWDWEAELAVVVGRTLRGADRAQAAAAVAGYTVANDLSARDWQKRTLEWLQGKAWDATTPLGPVVVSADEVDPAAGLDVVCRIDGEQVQRDSSATLVFDAPALLAYISTFATLRPGDLVLTGTPGGVGMARDPQRWLADGELLETEVEGIGVLRNRVRVVAAPAPSTT